MSHPDEGLIHAWLDGELDPAEAARVEALVASDGEWAAAAAEARGLIAASGRIVGALDRVPAAVVPRQARRDGAPRRWAWRAAAAMVLVAGSAIVLEQRGPELPPRAPAGSTPAVAAPAITPPAAAGPKTLQQAVPAPSARAHSGPAKPALSAQGDKGQSNLKGKVLSSAKSFDAVQDSRVPATANAVRAEAAPAAAGAASAGAAAAPQPAPAAAARLAPAATQEKFVRAQPSCFEQREPADSAAHIVRLSAAALADSIRLERLAIRGDTLVAVGGSLKAVRVRCAEP